VVGGFVFESRFIIHCAVFFKLFLSFKKSRLMFGKTSGALLQSVPIYWYL
jgi:hypothetical protein